jgi:hypothetical protein
MIAVPKIENRPLLISNRALSAKTVSDQIPRHWPIGHAHIQSGANAGTTVINGRYNGSEPRPCPKGWLRGLEHEAALSPRQRGLAILTTPRRGNVSPERIDAAVPRWTQRSRRQLRRPTIPLQYD